MRSTEAFFDAVAAGDLGTLAAALDAEPALLHAVASSAHQRDAGRGARALHVAAYHGHADVARLLVERGLDPATRSDEGRTALHVALECNDAALAVLLELGCPVDVCAAAALEDLPRLDALLARDPGLAQDMTTGLAPLGWAAFFGAEASTRRLLAAGADPSFDGPLFCAAQVAELGVAKLLVDAGADPAVPRDDVGGNVLHMAVCMRHTDDALVFVRWLLDDCGVDPRARTRDGLTARQLAERQRERLPAGGGGGRRRSGFDALVEVLRRAESA